MATVADDIAREVLRVINSSPRTPTKAQLADTIQTMLDVAADDEIAPPRGCEVFPQRPGAYVMVTENMGLRVDGWTIDSPRPINTHEATLAILEWMKRGVLTAPRA